MLSQAVYWSKRTSDDEGWFWKTADEWEDETGMSYEEQKSARDRLRKTSFWEEDRRGIPCKLYYRVDLDALWQELTAEPERDPENGVSGDSDQYEGIPRTRVGESLEQERGNASNKGEGKPRTRSRESLEPITETTTENTRPPASKSTSNISNQDNQSHGRSASSAGASDRSTPSRGQDTGGSDNPTARYRQLACELDSRIREEWSEQDVDLCCNSFTDDPQNREKIGRRIQKLGGVEEALKLLEYGKSCLSKITKKTGWKTIGANALLSKEVMRLLVEGEIHLDGLTFKEKQRRQSVQRGESANAGETIDWM
jgi:hypothetical protein